MSAPAWTPVRIPQEEFAAKFWTPAVGEHVCMVGPNGCGKTTLGLRLLASATAQHPRTRGVALAMKPHKRPSEGRKATGDETVASLTRQLGGRIVRSWPPPPTDRLRARPAFYTLWPEHSFDLDVDKYRHWEVFRNALNVEYRRGNSWVFADEIFSLAEELRLKEELIRILTKGRSMGCAMISATQRPAHVPLWAFSEGKHFFLWKVKDRRAYERLREIGNVDPQLVVRLLDQLGQHEALYLRPDRDVMAIIT